MTDARALKILTDTYWTSKGWRDESEQRTPPDDFAYARSKGLMFDPVTLTHDEAIAWLLGAAAGVRQDDVARAFVASLGAREPAPRSALASWTLGRHAVEHAYVAWDGRGGGPCVVCGVDGGRSTHDLNVLSFERHRFGGVRTSDPVYMAFDLTEFAKLPIAAPTPDDAGVLREILRVAGSMPPDARSSALEKALAKRVRSNKYERDALLATLAYCGVLEDPAHPGFADHGLGYQAMDRERSGGGDAGYPLCWWRGRHGVNERNAERLFGAMLAGS